MSPSSPSPLSAVLFPSADIEAALKDRTHRLNTHVKVKGASLTERVGIRDQGVHMMVLEPGQESTALHYHLQESEWYYILSGSGYLMQVDASAPVVPKDRNPPSADPDGAFHFRSASSTSAAVVYADAQAAGAGTKDESGQEGSGDAYQVQRHSVKAGDFVGFPAGVHAAKWGHSLVAGEEGLRYLCGGTAAACETCVYPLAGRAMVYQKAADKEDMLVLVKRDK